MAQQLIVTHISPDLDAVGAVWVLKRFDEQHFGDAKVAFVPAGEQISDEERQYMMFHEDDVVHVDTGKGKFDHHMEERANLNICATSLVRDYVITVHPELAADEALRRVTAHVVEIDHFGEFYWPEPNNDRYFFQLHEILSALKMVGKTDNEVVEVGMAALDAVYADLGAKVKAEDELKNGVLFENRWGKGIGFESANDEVIKLAQKSGFDLVVRKDPEFGHVRIKAAPAKGIDLTNIYEIIIGRDTAATWYLHPSKAMLLNGSRKIQNQVPSSLSLKEVIDIIEESSGVADVPENNQDDERRTARG